MIALVAFGIGQAAWPNKFALAIVASLMLAIRYGATLRLATRTLRVFTVFQQDQLPALRRHWV